MEVIVVGIIGFIVGMQVKKRNAYKRKSDRRSQRGSRTPDQYLPRKRVDRRKNELRTWGH